MSENISNALLGIIPVIGAVITYFLVPWMKANLDSAKLQQYREWASLAVKAAELLWKEAGHGDDKKAYVTGFLDRMFNSKTPVITREQMDILIESAVKQMEDASPRAASGQEGWNL